MLGWLTLVGVLEWRNPRLVPSWHGFLHSAIVTRFPSSTMVPENPFVAGEPLPYYWAYHAVAAALSAGAGISALGALQVLTFLALAALVLLALDAGRRLTGSTAAGLLVGFLALAGANPLGPVIAAAHYLLDGPGQAATVPTETVFVADVAADQMMSRPLLSRLYFGSDWRSGQNLVWFWDISSRAPSLAAVMLLVWILVRGGRRVGVAVAVLVLTALNPLIGIAMAVCLGGALLLYAGRSREQLISSASQAGAIVCGVLLAAPSFYHLFTYSGAGGLSSLRWILIKATYLTLNFGLLAALAAWAWLSARGERRRVMGSLVLSAVALLVLAVFAGLAEANEHNLANAAAVLLALPAGVAPWLGMGRSAANPPSGVTARLAIGIMLIHLPMTAATLVAFDHRPALPFRYWPRLERTPADGPLARLYEWIRAQTPREAVLVVDPDRPVKMSGNVSELPAFTGRVLFIDHPSYLTRPHASFADRTRVARALVHGEALSAGDREAIGRLARPAYLVSFAPDRQAALHRRHGAPLFTAGPVSVFLLQSSARAEAP